MSRRLLAVLTACCIAALSVTAVAFAHGTGGEHHGKKKAHHGAVHHRGGQPASFLGAGLFRAAVNSLAQRLNVEPAALRTAIRQTIADERAKQLAAAGLTPEEIAALKRCRTARHHRRADCDVATLKSARTKLKAAPKPDYDAIKADLAATLAQKLAKTPDEVLAAVRAELDARLTQAVQAGWLTQKGHDLALACFDTPSTCDVSALKGEIRFPGHHAAPSTSTPSDTTPPSTTMTPGGRDTSTPLR
jgi:transposase-like protein